MKILLNDKEITLPSSLSEITLGQRIAFQKEHGDLLDKMLESILAMEDELLRELELVEFSFEKMFRTFSFFASVPVSVVKESKFVDDIANIYYSCLAVLFEDEANQQLKSEFVFEGELWELAPPEVKHGDKRTFGEFIDAKQTVKDMSDLGNGKWESLLPLCAIHLRKKGEAYSKEFLYEDSERLALMKKVPMDIAMQVGFFLSSSLNFSVNILTSSKSRGLKEAVSI